MPFAPCSPHFCRRSRRRRASSQLRVSVSSPRRTGDGTDQAGTANHPGTSPASHLGAARNGAKRARPREARRTAATGRQRAASHTAVTGTTEERAARPRAGSGEDTGTTEARAASPRAGSGEDTGERQIKRGRIAPVCQKSQACWSIQRHSLRTVRRPSCLDTGSTGSFWRAQACCWQRIQLKSFREAWL